MAGGRPGSPGRSGCWWRGWRSSGSSSYSCCRSPSSRGGFGRIVGAILYVAVALGALAFVAAGNWGALFRRVRRKDPLLMVGFALLNVVVTYALATIARSLFATNANPMAAQLPQVSTSQVTLFFLETVPQLLGEELVTILPFPAITYFAYSRMNLSRGTSVLIAWLVTALLFALLHLPTYGWNVAQVLFIIGPARLILMLPYILTKNALVSWGAHFINDWIFFLSTLLPASAARG